MEGGHDSRMYITAVDTLHALHFQLHMIFPSGFTIFTFLPAVPILSVPGFLSVIQQHRAAWWSEI